MRGLRLGLLLAAAGTIIANGAQAQPAAQFPRGAVVQPMVPDRGAELRRHLTILADNPRSLDALIGAGRAALAGGDAMAALSFFSRAGEVAPRDSRVKAGMASVLVRMERGQPALNLFSEAAALGAPAWEIAGDRGLAHDMVGDPRRAQQDYAFVLQRREDAEVRRRLALSLAISGEREAALRVIEGQLRRNDRAALRTQAFILALTGDPDGANRTAQGLMPPAAAQAMAPFFARLATLTPAQKAMAAHFGRFPSNGRIASAGSVDTRADPGALALAGGQPVRPRTEPADTGSSAVRRRPGAIETAARAPARQVAERPARTRETRSATTSGGRPSLMQQRRALAELERGGRSQAPAQNPAARPSAGASGPTRTVPSTAARDNQPATRNTPALSQPSSTLTAPTQSRPARSNTVPSSRPAPNPGSVRSEGPVSAPGPTASQGVTTRFQPPAANPVDFNLAQPPAGQSQTAASLPAETAPSIRETEIAAAAPASSSPAGADSTTVAGPVSTTSSAPTSAGAAQSSILSTSSVSEPPTAATTSAPASQSAANRSVGLSDIAALVATLPEDEARAARRATPPPAAARTADRSTPRTSPPAPARARPAHPSRHWVQVAGGANAAALPGELARLRAQAPELVSRNAWVTPANATNRLLVGPFASAAEAQQFVNTLARRNVSAFAWTSEAGQEIARLQSGR